jgi:DNA-binding NarL/FixJ family response regulator
MQDRVPVRVEATDPLLLDGIRAQLRYRPEIELLDHASAHRAAVLLLVVDHCNEVVLQAARTASRRDNTRVVLIAGHVDDAALPAVVEAGVCNVIRRAEVSPERLVSLVRSAAAGDGTLPPDLLGMLMRQVGRLHRHHLAPHGLQLNGASQREIDVLRLIADGYSTAEIAQQLCFAERTIKNVLQAVNGRWQVRNRSQAVAYALREGLI